MASGRNMAGGTEDGNTVTTAVVVHRPAGGPILPGLGVGNAVVV